MTPRARLAADQASLDGPMALAGAVLAFWLAAGLIAGLGHTAELAAARHVQGRLVWFSREFFWMAPVTYSLILAPVAVLFAAAAGLWRWRWTPTLAAAAFATFAAFGLLLPYAQISRTSSLILSLGIGVAVARGVSGNPRLWTRAASRMALAGVAVLPVLALGARGWRSGAEKLATMRLGPPPPNTPNVLLIILDTVRAASLSLYSRASPTSPRLEAWAREGVVFDWALATAPWTLPSHASMFTGVYAGEQSGDWERPLDDRLTTIAEVFRDRGLRTAGFVANVQYAGFDSGLGRGFVHYDDYSVDWKQMLASSSYTQTRLFEQLFEARSLREILSAVLHPDLSINIKHWYAPRRGGDVVRDFLAWQEAQNGVPFFAFLNFMDAHSPTYAPAQFKRFVAARPGLGDYHAAIAYLDSLVDNVLVTLRERGVLDRTLVVVTSDHGELFGEHGLTGHAHNLYLDVLRVPLLIRFPDSVPQGRRISEPVSLRDLAATILDLARVESVDLPGTSLATTWNEDSIATSPVLAEVSRARNIEPWYPTSKGDMQSMLDEKEHFIRHQAGAVELYRYREDPLEQDNLAEADADHESLAMWRERLAQLLRRR